MISRKYEDRRDRESLEPGEILALLSLAKNTNTRDYCLLLLAYRHGLRANELLGLTWRNISLASGLLTIRRLKNGLNNGIGRHSAPAHPVAPDEVTAIREWRRECLRAGLTCQPEQRLFKISRRHFHRLLQKYARGTGLAIDVHPHMLRHSCATHLAPHMRDAEGVKTLKDYMGHRSVNSTMVYVNADPGRLKDIGGLLV